VACLPSADHEHADHEDGDQREHRRDHTGADVHERTGGVPEVRDQLLGDVLELRGDVVLLVRLLELWLLVERLVEVLGIAGQLVGQVDTLLDGGRNQDQRDDDRDEDDAQVDDRDRHPAGQLARQQVQGPDAATATKAPSWRGGR
jgi:hypothetical protein